MAKMFWAEGFQSSLLPNPNVSGNKAVWGDGLQAAQLTEFSKKFNDAVLRANPIGATGGWMGYTARQIFSAAEVLISGDTIRLFFYGSVASYTLTEVFVGHGAATGNAYDFASAPVRVTFSGANSLAITTPTVGGGVWSDPIPFNIDETKPLVVAYDFSGVVACSMPRDTGATEVTYWKAGTGASSTTVSGFSSSPYGSVVNRVIARTSGAAPAPSARTVTAAQTLGAVTQSSAVVVEAVVAARAVTSAQTLSAPTQTSAVASPRIVAAAQTLSAATQAAAISGPMEFTSTYDTPSALTGGATFWEGYTFRQILPAAQIILSGGRAKLVFDGSRNYTLGNVWVGYQAASGDLYDFDGGQVRVKFSEANGFTTSGSDVFSDEFILAIDETKPLLVTFDVPAAPTSVLPTSGAGVSGNDFYTKAGADAGTTNATGYNYGLQRFALKQILVAAPASSSRALTSAQTTSAATQATAINVVLASRAVTSAQTLAASTQGSSLSVTNALARAQTAQAASQAASASAIASLQAAQTLSATTQSSSATTAQAVAATQTTQKVTPASSNAVIGAVVGAQNTSAATQSASIGVPIAGASALSANQTLAAVTQSAAIGSVATTTAAQTVQKATAASDIDTVLSANAAQVLGAIGNSGTVASSAAVSGNQQTSATTQIASIGVPVVGQIGVTAAQIMAPATSAAAATVTSIVAGAQTLPGIQNSSLTVASVVTAAQTTAPATQAADVNVGALGARTANSAQTLQPASSAASLEVRITVAVSQIMAQALSVAAVKAVEGVNGSQTLPILVNGLAADVDVRALATQTLSKPSQTSFIKHPRTGNRAAALLPF